MRKTPTRDNTFSIIAGQYRRKKFSFMGDTTLRPTPNRIRETLFNWLQFDIIDARVLDCFAGSGALGLEALSRGAKEVVLVEKNPTTAQLLNKQIQTLDNDAIRVIAGDIFNNAPQQFFDVVFLDPPFGFQLVEQSLDFLWQHALISAQTLIYIESEYLINDTQLTILKQKQAASVHYCLAKYCK